MCSLPGTAPRARYQFSEDVLRLPAIKTSLIFSVGPAPVEGFRMIERHYFRNTLVRGRELMPPSLFRAPWRYHRGKRQDIDPKGGVGRVKCRSKACGVP